MLIGKVWIYHLQFVRFFVILCVCVFVQLRISPPRIKLAASNFAWWYIGVLGRESHILGNFAPPEAQNRTNQSTRGPRLHPAIYHNGADVESTCVEILPPKKTAVLVLVFWPDGLNDGGLT